MFKNIKNWKTTVVGIAQLLFYALVLFVPDFDSQDSQQAMALLNEALAGIGGSIVITIAAILGFASGFMHLIAKDPDPPKKKGNLIRGITLVVFFSFALGANAQKVTVDANRTGNNQSPVKVDLIFENTGNLEAISATFSTDGHILKQLQKVEGIPQGANFYSYQGGVFSLSWYNLQAQAVDTVSLTFYAAVSGIAPFNWSKVPAQCELVSTGGNIIPATFMDTSISVSPMENVFGQITKPNGQPGGQMTLKLKGGFSSQTFTTTTDTNGNYQIQVPRDVYYMDIYVDSSQAWAAVNATDALMAAKIFTHLITADSLQMVAGDVNKSGGINSTDAMIILKKSFPMGSLIYVGQSTFPVNGTSERNVQVTLMGDLNYSWDYGQ